LRNCRDGAVVVLTLCGAASPQSLELQGSPRLAFRGEISREILSRMLRVLRMTGSVNAASTLETFSITGRDGHQAQSVSLSERRAPVVKELVEFIFGWGTGPLRRSLLCPGVAPVFIDPNLDQGWESLASLSLTGEPAKFLGASRDVFLPRLGTVFIPRGVHAWTLYGLLVPCPGYSPLALSLPHSVAERRLNLRLVWSLVYRPRVTDPRVPRDLTVPTALALRLWAGQSPLSPRLLGHPALRGLAGAHFMIGCTCSGADRLRRRRECHAHGSLLAMGASGLGFRAGCSSPS
jgi:hypothetical protein